MTKIFHKLCLRTTLKTFGNIAHHGNRGTLDLVFQSKVSCELTLLGERIDHSGQLRAQLRFPAFSHETPITLVNIVRAGEVPAYTCFERLSELGFTNVHIDTFFTERETDAEEQVIGTKISGTKIGTPIADRIVVPTDPMAATGGTLLKVLKLYKEMELGDPRLVVPLHLILTPEYILRMKRELGNLGMPYQIMAIRVDRGMSDPGLLMTTEPGERLAEERGLNDKQYIVPGGGGFGELATGTSK